MKHQAGALRAVVELHVDLVGADVAHHGGVTPPGGGELQRGGVAAAAHADRATHRVEGLDRPGLHRRWGRGGPRRNGSAGLLLGGVDRTRFGRLPSDRNGGGGHRHMRAVSGRCRGAGGPSGGGRGRLRGGRPHRGRGHRGAEGHGRRHHGCHAGTSRPSRYHQRRLGHFSNRQAPGTVVGDLAADDGNRAPSQGSRGDGAQHPHRHHHRAFTHSRSVAPIS